MTKKIGLLLLSLFIIFGFGASFADVIPYNSHRIDRCVKLGNVEIGEYKAIQAIAGSYHPEDFIGREDCGGKLAIYEVKKDECLNQGEGYMPMFRSCIYLVNKSVNISDITTEFINENAIFLGTVHPRGGRIENSNSSKDLENLETTIYKIEKSGLSGEIYELKKIETTYSIGMKVMNNEYTVYQILISWAITILIEVIILFLIAKIFWKSRSIKNRKIIFTGILASIVTLPLLRFIFPIFFSSYRVYVIFGEILVAVIETFIIKYSLKIERKMAIFASVICNLCSFLIGLFIF